MPAKGACSLRRKQATDNPISSVPLLCLWSCHGVHIVQPAMSLMEKKDAIVSALKAKLLPAAAPPPPAPIAISGAPTSVSGTPVMQSVSQALTLTSIPK